MEPTFASLLRESRPRRFTQQYAGEHIGVSDSAISTWERGGRVPSVDDFAKLCALYGVDDAEVVRMVRAAGGGK
jgi:transcriptional regulator with XRE-family HTH domain